jgi:quercetin dioxygenase-like cupin family protein
MTFNPRHTLVCAAAALLSTLSLGFQAGLAAADGLPPGVTIAANDAFAPPAGLGAFQAMTFVIDMTPGSSFPQHSHPGRSIVMMLQGELTENQLGGQQKVYHAGETFIEEPNAVHQVKNTGSDNVRLVWTLLLPDGTEPIMLHSN